MNGQLMLDDALEVPGGLPAFDLLPGSSWRHEQDGRLCVVLTVLAGNPPTVVHRFGGREVRCPGDQFLRVFRPWHRDPNLKTP